MIDNELPPEPETDSPNLRPIVAAAARGDVAAFAHVISRYHADMKRISLIVTRDAAIAEQAVQSAWQNAWRDVGKLRHPERLPS